MGSDQVWGKTDAPSYRHEFITHADGSSRGSLGVRVSLLFICLFIHTISQKQRS